MIRFKVPTVEGHFLCPSTPQDVLFKDFLAFLNLKKPTYLLELEKLYSDYQVAVSTNDASANLIKQEIEEKTNYNNIEFLNLIEDYFVQAIIRFIEIDAEDVLKLRVDNIEFLYYKILEALNVKDLEIKENFEYNGVQYGLPESLMSKATLIEYLEAAQLQAAKKNVENGNFAAMYDILCVLLRQKHEGAIERYTEQVYWRNQKDFAKINLQTVSEVSFFLQSRTSSYAQTLQIYTLSQVASWSRQVFKI